MRGPGYLSSMFVGILSVGFLGAIPAAPRAFALDAPSTQPVSAPLNPVLLVLPITAPPQAEQAWMGRAIQQDLVADLTQMTKARVISPASAAPATDEQSALDQARREGAGFAIYGQAQVSGNQLRITGAVLDVAAGKPIGSLKATAPTTNLFPLEDSLAAQAVQSLPYPLGMAGAPQPQQPTATGQTPPAYSSQPLPQTPQYSAVQAPPDVAPSPYYSYTEVVPPTYYTYNPYYAYPYWGYPYGPYWGGGVYIGVGGGYWGHYWGGPYYRSGYGFGRPGFGYRGGFGGGGSRGGGGGGHRR